MDLFHLRTFVVVAEELHFSRAAKKIHISQPALTKQIQQLETDLGVQLFARNRREVRVTTAGQHLLEKARRTLASAEDLTRTAERLARGDEGLLRIGFTPTAPQDILPSLVQAFRRKHPDVRVELQEASSAEQLDALTRGSIDVGIYRSQKDPHSGTRVHKMFEEPFFVALPRGHALAQRKRVSLESLKSEPWIFVRREVSPTVFDTLLDACRGLGFSPTVAHTVSQAHAALALVGVGSGIAVVPASVRHYRLREVTFVPLRQRLVSALVLGTSDTAPHPALQAFLDVCSRTAWNIRS